MVSHWPIDRRERRQRTITGSPTHVACTREPSLLAVAEPRVIAIDEGDIESGPLVFVEAPRLVAALADQPGFRILTLSELNGPFDAAAWPHVLSSDINYWKPETLGEALFNYWD